MRNILFRTSLIMSLVVLVSIPAFAQMKIGDSPTSITTGAQLDIEKSGSRTVFMDTGKVGIGDVSPASLLTVGSGDLFQVDSTGNIVKINNVTTSFPSSQGSAGTILTNNGSGTLTWSAPAGISADSLNFTDLSDSLLLDASTDIFSSGTNVLSVTNSGTGLSLRVNDDGTLTDSTPFVIDASGNVGIGVAAPASKLDVAGSIRFSTAGSEKLIATNGGTTFLEYDSTGNVFLRAYDGGGTVRDIALQTGTPATTRLFVDENGLVGIGDSSPAALLTVGSGDLFQVNSSGLAFAPAGTAAAPSYSFVGDTNSGLYNVSNDVASIATGGTERLRVTSTGNVGINLATYSVNGINPNHSLVVSGGTTAVLAAVLNTNSGTTNVTTGLGFSVNDVPIGKGGVLFERTGGWGLGKLHLATSSAADNSTNVALSDAKLTVDYSTGNVGIGDTSPAAMLTVGSGDLFQVNSSGSIAAAAGITMTSGALSIPNGDLGGGSTLRFKNASAANDAAMYETNGNILMVHAGASNSIVLRDSSSNYGAWFNFAGSGFTFNNIYDDAASRATLILNRSRSSATAPAAGFGTYLDFNLEGYTNTSQVGTGKISSIWENTQTNDTTDRDAALTFSTTADNSSAEQMRITSGGKLGIGTTSPAGKVQVVTTSDTTPSTVTAWDARHLTVGATGSTGSGIGLSYDQSNNIGYISAATPNTGWRDIIIGAGTANVGIGMTTAPTAKLTVSGGNILLDNGKKVYMGSITNGAGYFFDGTGAWGMKAYNSGSNYYTDIEYDSTGGSGSNSRGIRLMDWNGSAVRLFVGDTGNVGIGNTNPGYLLHVGSSSVTDGTTVLRLEDVNSTCSFTANTGAPTCGSDITLKKNITDLGGSLSKIDALRLVEYNWKTDAPGAAKQTGFIAQEVEKVFPKLVTEQKWIDGTNKKFLETAGLLPYIVGATQELSVQTKSNTTEISDLKKENADMKAEISDLKTRLNRLEEKLK